jgi:hypothetical protein
MRTRRARLRRPRRDTWAFIMASSSA